MKIKLTSILLIFTFLATSGFKCKNTIDPEVALKMQPIELNYWKVWDDTDALQGLIGEYQALHPNIKINYRKLEYSEYERELIEAFATDRGPDIFSIHNTWTRKYQGKNLISPMPTTITTIIPTVTGSVKKDVEYKKVTTKFSTTKLKTDFIDVVYNDVVIRTKDAETQQYSEGIYGLPLFVDTLALYYNKNLFNNAGISTPPEYWDREFQQDVKKLTKQNNKGEIIQAGVAMGGGNNIDRSTDILSALMMQNGTVMMSDQQTIMFHTTPPDFKDKNFNPGLDALRFYSDFANPAKEVYSWNNTLDNSLNLFIQGKLAMMFGYAYMLPQIKANAPKLNFAISKLPQIPENNQTINFANYWVEAVSNKILTNPENLKQGSDYARVKQEAAWDFIRFISQKTEVQKYLAKVKKPTALREIINDQIDDPDIGIFAGQALTAKSWYKGADANAAETIIKEMIDDVQEIQASQLPEILSLSAAKVQQTIK
ncbi:MAG: extracellular solute-binding protein [bacterium]